MIMGLFLFYNRSPERDAHIAAARAELSVLQKDVAELTAMKKKQADLLEYIYDGPFGSAEEQRLELLVCTTVSFFCFVYQDECLF